MSKASQDNCAAQSALTDRNVKSRFLRVGGESGLCYAISLLRPLNYGPNPPAVIVSPIIEAAVDSVATVVVPAVGAIATIVVTVFNPVTATVQLGFDAIAFTIELLGQPVFTVRPRLCRQGVEPVVNTLAFSIEPLVDPATPVVQPIVDPISSRSSRASIRSPRLSKCR